MPRLTEQDLQILALERRQWRPGAKEQAIAVQLGITETRYYQLLSELIDRPEALADHPVLVNRLRRRRARRGQTRRLSLLACHAAAQGPPGQTARGRPGKHGRLNVAPARENGFNKLN